MAKQSPEPHPARVTTPGPSTILMVFRTIADTTWRIFTPIIICMVAGLVLDRNFSTAPWLLLVGACLGMLIAGFLVSRQYKSVTTKESRP